MTNVGGGRSHLGTIEESGLSDTQLSSGEEYYLDGKADRNHDGVGTDVSEEESGEEEFIYPGAPIALSEEVVQTTALSQPHPSPAQLEALCAAASSGDLTLLKKLFQNALETGEVEPFGLANSASTRTGFTALHAAASRGYLEIVTWLVESCGAMPDLEDKEGETPLHKAALNGHLPIVTYLLPNRADVCAKDADGWTALHNACSKGYLDIVRWLCEAGGAASADDDIPRVDMRSKGGWTPLMNASSKGHLPVVLYLLNKQSANPLVRNNWSETAYDIAAAVFEVRICEVLQKVEAEKWRSTTVSYNPLSVHTTVPLILYENQRLDVRLKTLAISGGRPRFSASGLSKQGRPPPFELKLPKPNDETGAKEIAAWRSDVQLPLRDDPWTLPMPGSNGVNLEGAERSHFWLSDWTLDVTHPGVDPEEGWQYSHYFSDPEEQWTADVHPQLEKMLTGNVALNASLSGSTSRYNGIASSRPSSSSVRSMQTWVRRRRWVRVMRRRLDMPPLPFLEPDGLMYHFDTEGKSIPYIGESQCDTGDGVGQELGSMQRTFLSSAQDYVARARYLVGNQARDADANSGPLFAVEARRAIAKLERATMELRQGLLGDDDFERKTQAEVLLNAYSRELERQRLAAGSRGLLVSGNTGNFLDNNLDEDDEDNSDEEFHYPGSSSSVSIRPASRSSNSTDHYSRPGVSRAPTDLTPQLSQAPEFRVPTNEAPRKVVLPGWATSTPHQVRVQWERDEAVHECRDCQRRFNFLLRRHCRRCGRIFCDRCSSNRALLNASHTIHEPHFPEDGASASSQRVCRTCYDEINTSGLQVRATSIERIMIDQEHLTTPGHLTRLHSSSQLSDLVDCPVCSQNLGVFDNALEQEAHVKNCLEGGSGTPQAAKYLVYQLPAESALIGAECVICLEEFTSGSTVARLSCFCSFHNACLSSWLHRGKSCPVHAR